MARRFEDIAVGDQLEMPASRGALIYGAGKDFNPDAVIAVSIVTHIWFDPVDGKEYVGLARLRRDGTYGSPNEKRTITGLAMCGWRKAKIDWIKRMKAMKSSDKVISIFSRRHGV